MSKPGIDMRACDRWGEGLHQAVEAKEQLPIQNETITLASISYQGNYIFQFGYCVSRVRKRSLVLWPPPCLVLPIVSSEKKG